MRKLSPDFLKNIKEGRTEASAGIFWGDLVGFTRITEHLLNEGKTGLEKLTGIINGVYEPADNIIRDNGGYIYNYSGDAFMAAFFWDFPVEKVKKELEALIVQRRGSILPGTGFTLSLKTGYSSGKVLLDRFACPGRDIFCLHGDPVKEAASLSTFSRPPAGDFRKTYSRHFTSYSDKAVEEANNEFRTVASLFISLDESTYENEALLMKILSRIISGGGLFNQLEYADKGFVLPAFWGIPKLKENFADEAAAAGLEILEISKQIKADVRVALTVGKAWCGFLGGAHFTQYTAIGDRVNTAARLMSLEEKALLTDSITAECVNADSSPIGSFQVKGKKTGISVHRINALIKKDRSGIFIGRKTEADEIKRSLTENGSARIILYGDAGIGKTFLARKILGDLDASYFPFVYLLNKASPDIDDFIGLLLNALKERFDIADLLSSSVDDEITRESYRYFLTGLSGRPDLDGLPASIKSKMLSDGIVYALNGMKEIPVFFIDDINYIDAAFGDLLGKLLNECRNLKVLGTVKGEKADIPELAGRKISLKLIPFDEAEIKTFLTALNIDADEDMIVNIRKRTEGVPFYLFTVAGLLRSGKDINEIPLELEAAVIANFDRMENNVRNFLRSAAVFGKIFFKDVVDKSLKTEISPEMLNTCIENDILEHAAGVQYVFKHNIIRELIYGIQLRRDASAMHKRHAVNTEILHPGKKELIAYHYENGGDLSKAGNLYKELGRFEFSRMQFKKALTLFERSMEVFRDMPAKLYKVKIDYSNCLSSLGDYKNYYKNIEECRSFYEGKRNIQFVYSSLIETYLTTYRLDEALELLNKYEKITKDSYGVNLAYGRLYYFRRNNPKALEHYNRVLRMKGRTDIEYSKVYDNTGLVYQQMGDLDKAWEYNKKAASFLKHDKMLAHSMYNMINRANICLYRNRFRTALKYYLKALTESRKIGDYKSLAALHLNIGAAYYYLSEFNQASEYLLRGLELSRKNGDLRKEAMILGNHASICAYFGDYITARKEFTRSLEINRNLNDPRGIGIDLSNLALIENLENNNQRAFELALESIESLKKMNNDHILLSGYKALMVAAIEIGRYDLIEGHIDEYMEIAKKYGEITELRNLLQVKIKLAFLKGEQEKKISALKETRKISRSCKDKAELNIFLYKLEGRSEYRARLNVLKEKIDRESGLYRQIKDILNS